MAKAERIVEAGALGDPRLKLEARVAPLDGPAAVNRDSVGLRQMIPFPGKLAARGEVAAWEAEHAFENAKAVERHVIAHLRGVGGDALALEILEHRRAVGAERFIHQRAHAPQIHLAHLRIGEHEREELIVVADE